MRIGPKLYGAALALSLCLPMAAHGAEAAGKKAPAPTPLSAYELYRLYGDKTWIWNTGGGRFSDDGRRFVAWVNDKGKQSFAEGRWVVDDLGQLCMRATWTNAEGAARASTCFGHRKIGSTIYQRRQPDGKWYVFRHGSGREDDEVSKLVPMDTVSAKAHDLKQILLGQEVTRKGG
ncbi:hypothetical protein RLEG12_31660 [Rhizobium leguminosarum bv. trifolii CB782]|uniref:DUF995 domain-containing protein n=1 Tax=Rhizobium hidalgonense TaxID=1538159 RepID=UPI00027D3327|nr:DUF995 domain-containing protein [Rhizobium hidalgonense]AHG47540.1 hypothetical protein RLEG12_31660 [Rhizobium leguminosarum bv. trifolii CB782]EJC74852.1 Protein of unknown function (DUF995) [Rhizobium leguminosarum bv. trifolii WSM2012]MDR9804237.1 DUF995 domain-containing protein [Rhizobium hidalgonense]QKK25620.1 DUF995 domain-containing protein [Rhizobium hidalgonense]RWX15963.1 DUF995 domain-containing protein [Rhizobium hidalgonense]